jgi:hypothetical protein
MLGVWIKRKTPAQKAQALTHIPVLPLPIKVKKRIITTLYVSD